MIAFWKLLSGMYEYELTSASPEESLSQINEIGIAVYHVKMVSELAVRFCMNGRDRRYLESYCRKRGYSLTLRRQMGLFPWLHRLKRRMVLCFGMGMIILATLYIPTRVLFLRVEGNVRIPDKYILEVAQECGMGFGTQRREIRSERVKNAMLERIPELRWAGVNTYGCVAVISVREEEPRENTDVNHAVSSIVASRDGMILSATATRGTLLCSPGQAVREGEILISGYTDCGRTIRATAAQGEVFAQTLRSLRMAKPLVRVQRGESTGKQHRISMIFGKKRINLWKDSGIWDVTCGRMYQEYVLTLPGGFALPVALGVETYTYCASEEITCDAGSVQQEMIPIAQAYILQLMNAGSIQAENYAFLHTDVTAVLEGEYICTEMVGRIKPEQIGE